MNNKKYISAFVKCFMLSLMLLPVLAEAQDNNMAYVEKNFAKTLWFSTGNAAGLAIAPLNKFNTVGLDYYYTDGAFKRKQEGKSLSDIRFQTQGAMKSGKVFLWGKFGYDNITENGTKFNTLLYNPFDERFLYNVADTSKSNWKKQSYDLEFKAAVPVVADKLYVGMHLIYSDKIAAKQIDPRAESYKYNITVKPSAVFLSGKSSIGINGYYSNTFERTNPTNSNNSLYHNVYVLKGLGNYVLDVIGGNGSLNTFYYKCNSYGGGLQYYYVSEGSKHFKMLAEAGFIEHKTNVRQGSSQPQKMGSTKMDVIYSSLQCLFGQGGTLNKISASYINKNTDGTEYTSVWSTSRGEWVVATQAVMSNYATNTAEIAYDRFICRKNRDSYDWRLSASARLYAKNDEYYLPNSTFDYDNCLLNVKAGKNISFAKSDLLLSLKASYNYNISGKYNYTGNKSDAPTITDWYAHDIKILTSDFMQGGIDVKYGIKIRDDINLGLSGSFSYLYANKDKLHRTITGIGVNLIF